MKRCAHSHGETTWSGSMSILTEEARLPPRANSEVYAMPLVNHDKAMHTKDQQGMAPIDPGTTHTKAMMPRMGSPRSFDFSMLCLGRSIRYYVYCLTVAMRNLARCMGSLVYLGERAHMFVGFFKKPSRKTPRCDCWREILLRFSTHWDLAYWFVGGSIKPSGTMTSGLRDSAQVSGNMPSPPT